MVATDRVLYGTALSVYCCKLRLALALKGLALPETPPPDGYTSAAYRRFVPQGTVPALIEGDFVLTESDAIIEYLDEIGAGRPLMPQGARMRARARALSRQIDTRLEPAARALFPFVGARLPVPEAARQALTRPLDIVARGAEGGRYLSGTATPGLPDCGYWAVRAVLKALEGALGLWLDLPETGPPPTPESAEVLETYRRTLAGWVTQKMEGA